MTRVEAAGWYQVITIEPFEFEYFSVCQDSTWIKLSFSLNRQLYQYRIEMRYLTPIDRLGDDVVNISRLS